MKNLMRWENNSFEVLPCGALVKVQSDELE